MSLAVRTPIYGLAPRQRFLRDVRRLAGGDVRVCWTPKPGDGAVVVDEVGNIITWDGDVSSRITPLGKGWQQSFSGTGQFGTTPDRPLFSWGNGSIDRAFSTVGVIKVADTAALKVLFAKAAASNNEWGFDVSATELLRLFGQDQSAAATAWQRTSSAAIAIDSWAVVAASYNGGGGATAADGAIVYEGGAEKASTASNSGTYVAMEDLTSPLGIGAFPSGSSPFSGAIAFLLVVGGVISPAAMAEIRSRCAAFFSSAL